MALNAIPSTHRLSLADRIDRQAQEKDRLLASLPNAEDPSFARISQQLTEARESLRALQKVLEQENQFALEQMKSMENTNSAVFR